jgi:hypothetical protein
MQPLTVSLGVPHGPVNERGTALVLHKPHSLSAIQRDGDDRYNGLTARSRTEAIASRWKIKTIGPMKTGTRLIGNHVIG